MYIAFFKVGSAVRAASGTASASFSSLVLRFFGAALGVGLSSSSFFLLAELFLGFAVDSSPTSNSALSSTFKTLFAFRLDGDCSITASETEEETTRSSCTTLITEDFVPLFGLLVGLVDSIVISSLMTALV
jgi:hypothetical protein